MKKRYSVGTRVTKSAKKNFCSLFLQNYAYKEVRDFFYFFTMILPECRVKNALNSLYFDLNINKCNIHHFMNKISLSNTPWITTFEGYLPQPPYIRNSTFLEKVTVKRLTNKSCKKIIAFSKCSYDLESRYLDKFPAYKDDIMSKICILHPPQPLIIEDYNEKDLNDQSITFTFVGHEFFRKGGMEIVMAFDHLLQKNYPIKLNIISSLKTSTIIPTQKTHIDEVIKFINKYPKNVFYYKKLPYHEVLEIFKQSHVGLLPTYSDTYGYSVLESQACGCPVISTDVRALPETNNGRIGWLIHVPKVFKQSRTRFQSDEYRRKVSEIIKKGLIKNIKEIVGNKQIVREKGIRALEKIRTFHNPETRAKELELIYDNVLAN
jgi:glycosyltransferase involved in cell wall biosynthesis